ncbi:MAG: hypothetical protein CMH54_11980 [Myxococcales bacterium]|nr:hypothetical protein [Myxococcales bacterium]
MSVFFFSVFCLAVFGLVATYAAYPIMVIVGAWLKPDPPPEEVDDDALPSVSFIIAAYNEEASIASKIQNTLEIDYPADRFEVLVASDGSTDATDEIVRSHEDPRVRLVRNEKQGGKTATTNQAVEAANGDILVFSDATGLYNTESVRLLVRGLMNDAQLGAVAGRVVYNYDQSTTAQGFKFYQRWVVAQRKADPNIHTATSVSGSIHAVWRKYFRKAPSHLSYDMVVPSMMAMHNRRTGYEPDATSQEITRLRVQDEFKARTRISVRAYSFLEWLWTERDQLQDERYAAQLFFHKVLRWFSPHLLLLAFAAHLGLALLEGGIFLPLFLLHIGLYLLAGVCVLAESRGIKLRGSGPIVLFTATNAAFMVGFWRWLHGTRLSSWTPDREAEEQARGTDS